MSIHGDVVEHGPCPECGSADNFARYDDGYGKCFGATCEHWEGTLGEVTMITEVGQTVRPKGNGPLIPGEAQALPARGLTLKTCEKYDYTVGYSSRGEALQLATYRNEHGQRAAQHTRGKDKKFGWTGEHKGIQLFGQHLWKNGGRRVVITEGELDCMSLAQAMDLRWPVVSIPDGAGSAKRSVTAQIDWLCTHDEVVIMFDDDEPGQAAALEVAALLPPGRAKIAHLPLHDANDMLLAGRTEELVRAVWEAKTWRPDGIVRGEDLWDVVSAAPEHGLRYPWPELSAVTYGMRQREVVTWCGGTGIGKSSLVREVAHFLASTHGVHVGIVALEESVRRAGLAQMSIACERQLHLPPVYDDTDPADLRRAFDETLGSGRYTLYDHFGSVTAESLLPRLRYMVHAEGCKYLILDHVSIMVSGEATQGDERKRIDELMTKLVSFAQELDVGLHIVSHLRKAAGTPHEEGGKVSLIDLRGSGAIGQLSDIVIGAERNQQDEMSANVMQLRVLKNRFSGTTGLAGQLTWHETGRLLESKGFDPAAATDDEKGDF